MRILYFTRDFTPHDYRFLTTLAESGQEVYFLRLEQGRQVEQRPLPAAVNWVDWRGGRAPFRWRDMPVLLRSLNKVLREVKPDILHAGPIQTTAFLAALSGFRPLASMSWGSDLLREAGRSRWYRWITRFTLRRSTVMIGDCDVVRRKAVSFGLPDERIFTFPWGIDLNRFKPWPAVPRGAAESCALRERLDWQDCVVALSLRSWEPVYGIDVLLEGFARAARGNPALRLLMLGGGSQADLVHRLIHNNGLENRVHLAGQVSQNDLPALYHAADLYLSASHSDGSSVSLMEALGSGVPVLVSDIPGNQEWIEHGQQGWLFGDGDSEELARWLLEAASDRDRLACLGRKARRLAEERADWAKNFPFLLKAYAAAVRLAGKE